ncbi:MAG TPA: hypothetical protein VGF99_02675 [Myxococcota bacterium]
MRTTVVVVALAAALSTFACTAEAGSGHGTHDAAKPAAPATAKTPAGPIGTVLGEAEVLRQTLADDRTDTLSASATKLDTAAKALDAQATKVPGGEGLTAATKALVDVTSQPTIDLKVVRVAYGELQKALVGIIAADASLQAGRYLFECPMAKGYQRWVQVTPQMANPYMGKRMLECGMALEAWKVAG